MAGAGAGVVAAMINAGKAFGVVYPSIYKGLAFFAQSPMPLSLPAHAEVVTVQSISIPEF